MAKNYESVLHYTTMRTVIGEIFLGGGERGVSTILFDGQWHPVVERHPAWKKSPAPFREAIAELRAYFSGELREFSFAIDRTTGTPFQRTVWNALEKIPYGEVISYGDLARAIEKPTAFRAVGNANGKNHLPIVIPCHRVIATGRGLGGFGGGLSTKRLLLEIEGLRCSPRDVVVASPPHGPL